MKIQKGIQLKLSCYKCGGVIFENTKQDYTIIEDMYFLENNKATLKCCNCGLVDYLKNLVPRAFYHEEIKE